MKARFPLVLLVAVTACSGNGAVVTTGPVITTTTTAPLAPTLPPVVECPGEGDFEEGGGIADIDGTGSDSDRLGRISWESSDMCETFRFHFETSEGAPATVVPTVDIDHLPSFQVVRIAMEVDATVVTDQLVETNLVDRLYVVRSLDGGMFVDLHLTEPAAVRVVAESSPARLMVELRPGFVEFEGESIVGDNVVVVSPTTGATVTPEITVIGYSRTSEGDVVVAVTQGGVLASDTSTTAADHLETWGEFRVETVLPTGEVSVLVGEAIPVDGSLVGVTFDLTVN